MIYHLKSIDAEEIDKVFASVSDMQNYILDHVMSRTTVVYGYHAEEY